MRFTWVFAFALLSASPCLAQDRCATCKGSGTITETCAACGGTGIAEQTERRIFGCEACGGDGCHCIRPLCGGLRGCSCASQAVDCGCSKKICRFAGTNWCCFGSHEDAGKQRCQTTCDCKYEQDKCGCSVSCNCSKKKK